MDEVAGLGLEPLEPVSLPGVRRRRRPGQPAQQAMGRGNIGGMAPGQGRHGDGIPGQRGGAGFAARPNQAMAEAPRPQVSLDVDESPWGPNNQTLY